MLFFCHKVQARDQVLMMQVAALVPGGSCSISDSGMVRYSVLCTVL